MIPGTRSCRAPAPTATESAGRICLLTKFLGQLSISVSTRHAKASGGSRRGLNIIRRNVFSLWTCGNYALLYLAFTGAVIAGQPRDFARWLAAGHRPLLAAFLATYFGGYLLLYAWFAPVSGGPRLVLALFLPALYVCLGFLSRSPLSSRPTRLFGRELYTGTFFVLVLLLLLIEVVTIFPVRTGSTYFGD